MASTSASSSTLEVPAWQIPLMTTMVPTLAPSAVTQATEPRIAPKTDLRKVLYICSSPYNPTAWCNALINCNISHLFPNLVHSLSYGSPIGNPPPLSATFLPQNLSSANLHPSIINQELLDEVANSHMSCPFSSDEAAMIFGGFFRCSPIGLVEKVPGDSNWRMIRHLSKQDKDGNSISAWLDSDDFPTRYFTSMWVAQFTSSCLNYSPAIILPLQLLYLPSVAFGL